MTIMLVSKQTGMAFSGVVFSCGFLGEMIGGNGMFKMTFSFVLFILTLELRFLISLYIQGQIWSTMHVRC